MATNYSERVYKISVDGAQAIKSLEKISDSASSIDKRMQQVGSALKAVFAVGAIVAGAKAVADEVLKVAERFDDMGKAAQKVGVAAETLSALAFAAAQSGVGFETLQVGLRKMAVGLTELDDATSKSGTTLKALGVTAKDTADTAFTKVAQKLSEMPDGFQKTAAAMAIFGKSGAELIPLLNEGAEGIKKAKDRAGELGLILKDSTIAQLTVFNDSLNELKKSSEGLRNRLVEGLAPALASIAKTLADSKEVSEVWIKVGRFLGEVFLFVTEKIYGVIAAFGLLKDVVMAFESKDAFNKAFGDGKIWTDYNNKVEGFSKTLRTNMTAMDALTESGKKTGTAVSNLTGKMEPSAIQKWLEGLTKSAEELDLLPEKIEMLKKAMDVLTGKDMGQSNLFKVMQEEYLKLDALLNKDNLFYKLEADIVKTKEKLDETSKSVVYLQEQLALAIDNSDYDRQAAIFTMLKSLQGETDKTADSFAAMSEKIVDAINSQANNAVNKFIDNIGNAQMSFGDFAAAVVKDIAKIVVQLLIMKPLIDSIKGYFGMGSSGAQAFPVNAQGNAYSSGTSLAQGIYTQPTLFKFAKGGTFGRSTGLMGEAGPEAIVPLKRTASGDLGVQASPVNVNVYNNAGADVQTRTTDNADGTRQIDILIEKKVRDGIASGSYDRVMRGSYGLARVGA